MFGSARNTKIFIVFPVLIAVVFRPQGKYLLTKRILYGKIGAVAKKQQSASRKLICLTQADFSCYTKELT
jgi:hypothetical protein